MKISIKIRVIPLMLTLFLIISGCANHSLSNTTDSESTSTSTIGTILDKTDNTPSSKMDTNNTTKTTVNVEKIEELSNQPGFKKPPTRIAKKRRTTSQTDPDSGYINHDNKRGIGYLMEATVDCKHGILTSADV